MPHFVQDQPLDLYGVVDALRDNIDGETAATGQRELAVATEHHHSALVALAVAADCAGNNDDLNALVSENRQLALSESLWRATHLTSPTAALAMAKQNGWGLAP